MPKHLKTFFIIHFIADFIFAIPLFFAPEWTLELLGFTTIDVFSARIIAAALFGIGGVSLIAHKRDKESYKSLLDLKIIWSISAITGMLLSLEQAPQTAWMLIGIFMAFSLIWIYYRIKHF